MQGFFSKILTISFLIVSIGSIAVFVGYQTTYQNPATTPKTKFAKELNIYQDEAGNPKYALGECKYDGQCFVIGCYQHICTSKTDHKPICEYDESFPDANYQCRCLNNQCVWLKKD